MNILFVCLANRHRSPTAEKWAKEKFPENNYKSAGVGTYSVQQTKQTRVEALIVTPELLEWADKIFVFEKDHINSITDQFGFDFLWKITNLEIGDHYTFDDSKLLDLLEIRLKPLLNSKTPTTPENIKVLLNRIPLEIQIASVLSKNGLIGSEEQIQSTIQALRWICTEEAQRLLSSINPK